MIRDEKSAVGLDMPRYSISHFFSFTSFIFLSRCQLITLKQTVHFLTRSRLFIPKNHESCFLHWTWCPYCSNVAKVLLMLNSLDIQTRPSWKQHFWIRLSRCELALASFWMFLRWNNFWLFPLDWNVDRLDMQKGSINVQSMSIFKLNNF